MSIALIDVIKNNKTINTILFDACGVLYGGGSKLYDQTIENLTLIKELNVKSIVLSNMSLRSQDGVLTFDKMGMKLGVHYNDFITAGDVTLDYLLNIDRNIDKPKIFPLYKAFQGFLENDITVVNNINEASCIHVGTIEDKKGNVLAVKDDVPPDVVNDILHQILSLKSPSDDRQLVETIFDYDVYSDIIRQLENIIHSDSFSTKKTPIICTNADLIALSNEKLIMRQGLIISYLAIRNIDVLCFGKPFKMIYDYAIKKHSIDPSGCIMIGDQFVTDMCAKRYGFLTGLMHSSITDITKNFMFNGFDYYAPDFIIKSFNSNYIQ